jgi:hypothetical protein
MRKAMLVGLLATGLTGPVAAYAQATAPVTMQPTKVEIAIDPQWLAIGAGVVVGAAVFDVVLDTDLAFIIGGVVGGFLADVWYSGNSVWITSAPKS